jgi:hypothetical protein
MSSTETTPSGKPLDGAGHRLKRDPHMPQLTLFTMMRRAAQLVAAYRHRERNRPEGDDCADEKQVHDLSPDGFIVFVL